MKILLLGGTADARQLADRLHLNNEHVIYSIAGLVRVPKLGCEVLVGGFTQFGSLESYLSNSKIDLVINATHPYAKRMTDTAVRASKATNVECWRFLRQEWPETKGDRWIYYNDDRELSSFLSHYCRPLLSAGQHPETFIQDIVKKENIETVYWRTAVPPKFEVPEKVDWHKAIGPFELANERKLIADHDIDVVVSKNSGGSSTYSKLEAARALGIPVLMNQRPETEIASATYSALDEIMSAIAEFKNKTSQSHGSQQGNAQQ